MGCMMQKNDLCKVMLVFTILICSGLLFSDGDFCYHSHNENQSSITHEGNVEGCNLVPICAKNYADLSTIQRSNKNLWYTD